MSKQTNGSIRTEVKTITPKWAMEILDKHNPVNRSVSEQTVQSYANDMKAGRWVLNHQGIAFDENGNLVDGQHRLWACVFAECSFECMVTTGLPIQVFKDSVIIKAMDTVDKGRARTTGQQFTLAHNVKNGNSVASAIVVIVGMICDGQRTKRLTTTNSLMVNELYGSDIQEILSNLPSVYWKAYITGPLAMFHHGEPEQALEFCRQISTLENMSPAVRAFIKFLQVRKGAGGKVARELVLRGLSTCLFYFHKGEDLRQVKDSDIGTKYLLGMFPSMNKKINDALKPMPGTFSMRKKLFKVDSAPEV